MSVPENKEWKVSIEAWMTGLGIGLESRPTDWSSSNLVKRNLLVSLIRGVLSRLVIDGKSLIILQWAQEKNGKKLEIACIGIF